MILKIPIMAAKDADWYGGADNVVSATSNALGRGELIPLRVGETEIGVVHAVYIGTDWDGPGHVDATIYADVELRWGALIHDSGKLMYVGIVPVLPPANLPANPH